MDRQAWLEQRRGGLGATDIASLAGVGFRTPTQVYESKVNPLAEADAHPLMLIGLATEELNADLYARRMDTRVVHRLVEIDRHPLHLWAAATLDRVKQVDGSPVELKYTPFFGDRWGDEFTDEIPDGYLVQTQWQMFVVGADQADVSVLSGTGDHRVYRVLRNDPLIGLLLELGRRFWSDHVLARVPPPADWCALYAGKIEDAIPTVRDEELSLGEIGDPAHLAASEYLSAKRVAKEAEEIADAARAKVETLMGEAAKATAGPLLLSRTLVEGGKEISYVSKPYVRLTIREPKPKRKS